MRVLFITRKYPPQIGGMENYCYGLIRNILCKKRVIALDRPQYHLFWFLPYAFFKGVILSWGADVIFLCDSLLAPLGYLLKLISRKPVFIAAHGLDVTYNKYLYQNTIIPFLKKLDLVLAVSRNTVEECKKRGVKGNRCKFIPNGVSVPTAEEKKEYGKNYLEQFLNVSLENKKILFSLGRLIPRKGVEWFIKEVFGKLPPETIYVIAGEGPKRREIEQTVHDHGLESRIFIVGRIANDEREMLFQTADIFVMPNIHVADDVEGFGIVAIEAAVRGIPVVASKVEGIIDAIREGRNGFLVESGNAQAFEERIRKLLFETDLQALSEQIADYTKEHYSWKKISNLYLQEFEQWEMKAKN